MDIKELTYGVGSILRENVDGWATSDSGVNHVYPDHPPTDLSKSSYPRATVDVVGNDTMDTDVENEQFFTETLVDVTVYGVNSPDVNKLLGDSIQAVIDNWEGTDSEGSPYFETWHFSDIGIISEIQTESTDRGFTRYNKTAELLFDSVTTKS